VSEPADDQATPARPAPPPAKPNAGLGLGLVVAGLGISAVAAGVIQDQAWEFLLAGALGGLGLGLGLALVVAGAGLARGKRAPKSLLALLVLGLAALGSGVGPAWSRQARSARMLGIAQEELDHQYGSLDPYGSSSLRGLTRWFTREMADHGVDHAEALALLHPALDEADLNEAERLLEAQDAAELREMLIDLEEDETEYGVEVTPASRLAVQDALHAIYQAALASLDADVSGSRQFPVDPGLRTAFGEILRDLSAQREPVVHVSFHAQANLEPPEQNARLPSDAHVIPFGDAFAADQDSKRRDVFLRALMGAFDPVFPGTHLFDLRLLDGPAEGNLVFEVTSAVHLQPGYYEFTEGGKLLGFLHKVEVEWTFRLLDRAGQELYRTSTRSEPATEISINSDPSDPAWAPYSIMMDSAYYNYSREVTGRFGLEPPAPRTSFSY
jgi:hypothetical protein